MWLVSIPTHAGMADARVDGDGKFRFQLGREDIPLTNRLRLNSVEYDKEHAAGLRYIKKWLRFLHTMIVIWA